MTNDKNENKILSDQADDLKEENKDQQPLPVHNPLNPKDGKQITQQDIENEQKYKEALTERD